MQTSPVADLLVELARVARPFQAAHDSGRTLAF